MQESCSYYRFQKKKPETVSLETIALNILSASRKKQREQAGFITAILRGFMQRIGKESYSAGSEAREWATSKK